MLLFQFTTIQLFVAQGVIICKGSRQLLVQDWLYFWFRALFPIYEALLRFPVEIVKLGINNDKSWKDLWCLAKLLVMRVLCSVCLDFHWDITWFGSNPKSHLGGSTSFSQSTKSCWGRPVIWSKLTLSLNSLNSLLYVVNQWSTCLFLPASLLGFPPWHNSTTTIFNYSHAKPECDYYLLTMSLSSMFLEFL